MERFRDIAEVFLRALCVSLRFKKSYTAKNAKVAKNSRGFGKKTQNTDFSAG